MSKINHRKKKSKRETLHNQITLRFRYWEGWALVDRMDGKCLFKIPYSNEKAIERLKKEIYEKGSVEAIPELIRLKPDAIRDDRVAVFVSRFRQMSPSNKQAKEMFERIEKAFHDDLRGRTDPEKLKTIIEQDIKDFKEMMKQRLQGHTVQGVIGEDPNKSLVWNHYIKPSRIMLASFGGSEQKQEDWDRIFKYFNVMVRNFDQPAYTGFSKLGETWLRWMLVKSDSW